VTDELCQFLKFGSLSMVHNIMYRPISTNLWIPFWSITLLLL